ncbi:hypothetical protein LIER_00919 [Lithospermum erythrorhizon]|uniref:No apical meristem-associated C-terminal domain-containing protein n=1 Tax=Lithospermum erythrorhizon TaxID=34254 RepID=A0AAV3NMQ5_LITER
MSEWEAVRDQPRFASQVRGNTGSGSSGSKRAYESDAGDSNSVESMARLMGKDAAKEKEKKKGKGIALEVVTEEKEKVLTTFKQYKEKELECLDKIATQQEETLNVMKEKTRAKNMKMRIKKYKNKKKNKFCFIKIKIKYY